MYTQSTRALGLRNCSQQRSIAALSLLALLWLPDIGSAQIITLPNPQPPVPVVPASNATVQGINLARTTVQLRWNQWGVFNTPQQPLPTFFVVCVKLASQTANCTFAAGDFLTVGSIPSTKLYNGWQWGGNQYTYTVPAGRIADSLLDVPATWSVGACRGAGVSACSFSPPRPIWLSAMDIQQDGIGDPHGTTAAIFNFDVKNNGTTDSPAFNTSVDAWEALLDAQQRCRTDINAADVKNDPAMIAFMSTGDGRWIVDLPLNAAGQRVASGVVVGMHRWNGGFNIFGGRQMSPEVPAGRSRRAAQLTFPVPVASRPKAYIAVMWADITGLVREYDENNNSKGKCSVVY